MAGKDDNVNHPAHYKAKNGLEAIDVIEAFTEGLSGVEAVCTGNALKYLLRWKQKNGVEDLEKARWYLNRLIDRLNGETTTVWAGTEKFTYTTVHPKEERP